MKPRTDGQITSILHGAGVRALVQAHTEYPRYLCRLPCARKMAGKYWILLCRRLTTGSVEAVLVHQIRGLCPLRRPVSVKTVHTFVS